LKPMGPCTLWTASAKRSRRALRRARKCFLLPRGNLEEALGMARKIRLIPVETFEEAVAALRRLSAEE